MVLWWQRSIKAMNQRPWSAWASSTLLPSPYTRMSSAILIIPSRPSNADVSLMWNSSGAMVIPNGRRSHLYLPYDVCTVVIHEGSSSRGMCRRPSLTSTREKHFAKLSLWSCSFRTAIWCFWLWMALFTVWLGSMHTRNFFGVSLINSFEHHRVGSFTLTRTPFRTYRSKASFSFALFATGILWTGIRTGWTLLSILKSTGEPSWPRPSNVSA